MRFTGWITKKRVFKSVIVICTALFIVFIFGAASESCKLTGKMAPLQTFDFGPPPDLVKLKAEEINSSLLEASTYLTFPEWYIVYSSVEYTECLEQGEPSSFPYFASIGQYWRNYAKVYSITKQQGQFNAGDHLMLMVIGVSFTVENGIKGLYENSVGRITEWTAGGANTEEDKIAARASRNYVDFVPTRPFYEYPYHAEIMPMWTEPSFLGKDFIRKWERKIIFTVEFGVKAVYGWLIEKATLAIFGTAGNTTFVRVEGMEESFYKLEPRIVKVSENEGVIVAVFPRYHAFTEATLKLVPEGLRFKEIAGNSQIMLSVLAEDTWNEKLSSGNVLFSEPILTRPHLKRVVLKVPVKDLHTAIIDLQAEGFEIEHIHDF